MDYIREAVEYLKNYDRLETALENLRDEIKELRIDLKSVKELTYSDMPGGSGSALPDDATINKIYRLKKAEEEYSSTYKTLKRMNKVFEKFENENKNYGRILRGYFIDCLKEEQLMEDFHYSDRHLRRLKQQALRAFAIEIFGIKVISG